MAYAIDAESATQTVVDVIDTTNQTSVTKVPLPSDASAIAVTPDARFALVVLKGIVTLFGALPAQAPVPPEVVALSTSSNQLVTGVAATVLSHPGAIAITPDGTRAFVVSPAPGGCSSVCVSTVTPVSIGAGPVLKAETSFALPNSSTPDDVAVSPDGRFLYVLTTDGFLDAFALPGLGFTGAANLRAQASHMVISPDGSTAYVSIAANFGASPPPAGYILPVALGPTPVAGRQINLPAGNPSNPTVLAIATTPPGQSALFLADSGNGRIVGISLPGGPASSIPLGSIDDIPAALFSVPDGGTVEMTTQQQRRTIDIRGTSPPPGKFGPCSAAGGPPCPAGSGGIAITPDQRPVASFTATAAGPGQPSSFDASASTIQFGTIARYHWDFGDGSNQDTTGPTTTHPYANAGTYSVVLTETDWAGTSVATSAPSTIFTGQTMTRRGGPEAQTTRRISVPTTPTTPLSPSTSTSPPPPPSGSIPRISLIPKVGPPGTVVAVSGSGFPANAPVTLVWRPGIGTAMVTANSSGAFANTFVLVLPKDQLGLRQMVAQTFGATTTFLAVPPSLAPGGTSVAVQILFRR